MRAAAALLCGAVLVVAGHAGAAPVATDPIVGYWKVTRGGFGTIRIAKAPGIFTISARTKVRVGCYNVNRRDLVGFVELPSRTALPKGVYSSSVGPEGHGCNYAVRLRLSGRTIVGKVTYSENNVAGGPFTFVRTT